jgi:hypothetical protein
MILMNYLHISTYCQLNRQKNQSQKNDYETNDENCERNYYIGAKLINKINCLHDLLEMNETHITHRPRANEQLATCCTCNVVCLYSS